MYLLLKLVIARGGSYLVEQPSSSVLRWYNRFWDLRLHSVAAELNGLGPSGSSGWAWEFALLDGVSNGALHYGY